MLTVVYISLGLLGFSVALLALARLWVMKLSPESIQGSDLHMLKWCIAEDTRAWAGFHVTLDGALPFEEAKRAVKHNISESMRDPQSAFRRGVELETRRYVFYQEHTLEDVTEDVARDDHFFRLADDRKRELIYRFHDRRELIGALFDHTVWDGIRMFNETLAPALTSQPLDSAWFVRDRYLPVISELLMLYTLTRMGGRWLTHKPLPLLSDSQQQRVTRHRLYKRDINALKQSAGVKFTAALLASWAHRLYQALPPERTSLRFGLVVGMENPRFRNNYSILIIDLPREADLDTLARRAQQQMKARAIEVIPLYHWLSFVELQSAIKKSMVDCLFSPGFFTRDSGVSAHVRDLFLYVVPTSMPMYCFACTLGDEITVSTTWGCPEVSLDQLASDAEALYERGAHQEIKPVFERERAFPDLPDQL